MDAVASAEQRSKLEQAHGELRDAVTSVHNLNQLLRSIRVGSQAVAGAIRDMDAACALSFISASRDFLHTIEACLGAGSTGSLSSAISERCKELEQALKESVPLNATRRLQLEQVSGRFIQDLDAALVLIELLRDVTTNQPTTIDLSNLIQQRLPSDTLIPSPPRLVKASISIEAGSVEIESNPRAVILLTVLSAAFVTTDEDNSCHISLARRSGAKAMLSITAGARSQSTIDLVAPRLLKASTVCAERAARTLGAGLHWTKTPREALLVWAES